MSEVLSRAALLPSGNILKAVNGVWCDPKDKILFSKNFKFQNFDLINDFQYFEVPGVYVANDGTTSQNNTSGLTISSVPFEKRFTGILDHTKYLVYTQEAFYVPKKDAELFVEAQMTYTSTGLISSNGQELAPGIQKYSEGIQNIKDEPRLSAGALNLVDFSTGMVFDFILSDSTIYALYEHLPLNSVTSVFTFAKAVASRPTNENQTTLLRIGYNGFRKEVIWYIDGNPVFKVQNPGLPLADKGLFVLNGDTNDNKEVKSETLAAGFGTFSLLDFFPFDKSYEDIGQSYTIFPNNPNIKLVEPLTNLEGGNVYYKKMPNKLGLPIV